MVDDAPVDLQVYDRLLKTVPEVTSVTFKGSGDALQWCERNELDLLLLDYMMPDVDGLQFVRRFREFDGKATIPVVMITGELDKTVRYDALESGVDDFLTKPIDHIEFRARVKNMLRGRERDRLLNNRANWLADEVSKAISQLAERERETIFRLTRASEYLDNETGAHIARIGLFAAKIAEVLGLPQEERELLLLAAPMHDIGKVHTPDNILLKPGPLSPEEWEIMRHHPIAGFDILRDSPSRLLQRGAEIALTHHEKFDGTGYPFGIAGETIPISGRITALCDVFDALLSARPYKEPWDVDRVVAYITEQDGLHFDPKVVAAFKAALPELLEIRARCTEPHLDD